MTFFKGKSLLTASSVDIEKLESEVDAAAAQSGLARALRRVRTLGRLRLT